MNLRDLAEQDLGAILEDKSFGFGRDIKITSPDGVSVDFIGLTNDVALAVDPDTGMLVSGRTATISVYRRRLLEAGFEPKGVANASARPWVVEFADINGTTHKFKVTRADNDRAIGAVVMELEAYQ